MNWPSIEPTNSLKKMRVGRQNLVANLMLSGSDFYRLPVAAKVD
jgi:hypothetical protein